MTQLYPAPHAVQGSEGVKGDLKFHIFLADRTGTPEFGLWAYVRSLDSAGSGWAVVTLKEVQSVLGCGKSTFYRWLKRGRNFFRDWRNLGNQHFCIYYRSVFSVYDLLGLDSVGPIVNTDTRSLTRNGRKIIATEAIVLWLQNQAQHAANKAQKGRIINPQSAARSELSQASRGITVDRGLLKLDHNAPICPHSSMSKASRTLTRSISTIQRRTADQWRLQNGFDRIQKLRVIRKLNPIQAQNYRFNSEREQAIGLPEFGHSANFLVNPLSSSFQYVAKFEDGPYFLGGRIYASNLELRAYRWERRRIKMVVSGDWEGLRMG
jgi:hypothetical protein